MKNVIALSLLLALCLVACCAPAEETAGTAADPSVLTFYAINVRKADAHLLCCGPDIYLVDTGTEESTEKLLQVLRAEGITHLAGVILTHTHDDHAGGLQAVLDSEIEVDQVYASAYYNKKEKKHPAVKALKGTGREVVFLSGGDSLPLGAGSLQVLGPLVKNEDTENNNSLVLLASGGGGTVLLTGDMEFPEESTLLQAGVLSHVDVLKVGNHGESDATSDAFIAAVTPSIAVIPTNSQDEPDTPAKRVLKLLRNWQVAVYETQNAENGVLITLKDGKADAVYR